eukprot:COSAG01_NODE_1696_length_9461_cov_8.289010_7_plen_173_part_00
MLQRAHEELMSQERALCNWLSRCATPRGTLCLHAIMITATALQCPLHAIMITTALQCLAEIYLRFAVPILILMTWRRYEQTHRQRRSSRSRSPRPCAVWVRMAAEGHVWAVQAGLGHRSRAAGSCGQSRALCSAQVPQPHARSSRRLSRTAGAVLSVLSVGRGVFVSWAGRD